MWELRTAWAQRRDVRLTLTASCMIRTVVGTVDRVAATGAFVVVDGWHVPVSHIEAIGKPTFNDREAYQRKMRSAEVVRALNPEAEAA